jgi:O-succinylbenzoic acid--CoA ligase
MTETVSHVAFRDLREQKKYFRSMPGVHIQLNSLGCLMIQGPMTIDQWIETQDLVQIVDENTFEFLGRADRVINSGGKKIFPDVVETWVRRFYEKKKWAGEVLLVGLPDSFFGQKAILFTTNELDIVGKNQLIDFLKMNLPSEDCPKAIIYRPTFELLPNGKIDSLKTVALYVETTK